MTQDETRGQVMFSENRGEKSEVAKGALAHGGGCSSGAWSVTIVSFVGQAMNSGIWRRFLQSSIRIVPWSLRTRVKYIPGVAPFQRWIFDRALAGDSFVHAIDAGPAKGLIYPISLPQDKAIWTGAYERSVADTLAAVVRPGDICFDIGGHRGFMTGVCALAGAGLVIAFEPAPKNAAQIRRMAQLNPRLPIRVEELAVGDSSREVDFCVMAEDSMGKLAASQFQREAAPLARTTVVQCSLDDLVASNRTPPPQVVKIDVEGAEALVLCGAVEILHRHRPTVLLEAHSAELELECCELLHSAGYTTRWLSPQVTDEARMQTRHCLATPTSLPTQAAL